jgi:5-bromo-4-chloroindolyl phosphate hydrolysis protein
MTKNKDFDCVEMKNEIQEKLQKLREGMTDEEYRGYIKKTLDEADGVIGRIWKEKKEYVQMD